MSDASAEHRPFRMRHALLTAGLLLCILTVLFWRPLAIRFHHVGMQWAVSEHHAAMGGGHTGLLSRRIDQRHLGDWFKFHRNGLVRLNTLVHRQYRFVHVACPSPEAQWLEDKLVAKLGKGYDLLSMSSGRGHRGEYAINIWVRPGDVRDWDAWHASLNWPGVAEAGVAAAAADSSPAETSR
jgi:hypothetical protein